MKLANQTIFIFLFLFILYNSLCNSIGYTIARLMIKCIIYPKYKIHEVQNSELK